MTRACDSKEGVIRGCDSKEGEIRGSDSKEGRYGAVTVGRR